MTPLMNRHGLSRGRTGGAADVAVSVVAAACVGLMLLAAGMSGCDKPSAPTTAAATPDEKAMLPGKGFIAFVGAGPGDPLWPILKAGARRHVEQHARMRVEYLCPVSDSPESQVQLLSSLDDPQMRGLCVQISDTYAVAHVLHRLFNKGVRIVSMVKPAPERIRVAHVGFDEEAVGRELARHTSEAFKSGGSIMVLHAGDDDPADGPRRLAFMTEIKTHPQIDVFAELDCHGHPMEARAIIRERSVRYPRLSAWVALEDWPVQGVADVDKVLPPGQRLITFGGMPEHCLLLRKGLMPFMLAANYRDLGTEAARLCEWSISDPSLTSRTYFAPLRDVWASNLEVYERDWASWISGPTKTVPTALP